MNDRVFSSDGKTPKCGFIRLATLMFLINVKQVSRYGPGSNVKDKISGA